MQEKNIDFKQQTIRMELAAHKAFKTWCVQHDISMNIKINELIDNFMTQQATTTTKLNTEAI